MTKGLQGRKKHKSRTKKVPSKYEEFETSVIKTIQKKEHRHKTKTAGLHRLSMFSSGSSLSPSQGKNAINIKSIIERIGIDNMTPKEYIPTAHDNSHLVSVKEVNLLKKMHGRGLFANENIPEGTCLGLYTGLEYSIEEFKEYLSQDPEADNSYAMTIGRTIVDARERGNFTRYINFSDSQANVEFVEGTINRQKVVKVIATSNIQAGQQILVDYNTYDQRASKDYYFLNPYDGWEPADEVYQSNEERYSKFKIPFKTFINENNNDIVLHCLRNREFAKFMILVTNNPTYFQTEYKARSKVNKDAFKSAISDYDHEEKKQLFELLISEKINMDSGLLEELGFQIEQETSYSHS